MTRANLFHHIDCSLGEIPKFLAVHHAVDSLRYVPRLGFRQRSLQVVLHGIPF